MAEAEKNKSAEGEGEVEDQPKPKKSKRKLAVFVVIGIVILAVAAAGGYFMLKKKHAAEDGEGADATAESAQDEKKHDQPPVYVKLDTFTTNLAVESADQGSGTSSQYIQIVVELKVEDAPAGETLKQYMPEIRNNILRLLSSRKPSQLASSEGKDLLASEIRDSVNGVANPSKKSGKTRGPVESVLFSSFIIQ